MALRELVGTLCAVAALVAALWLVVLPAASPQTLPTLVVLLALIAGGALLRANPAVFAAASLMGWFSVMIVHPFSLSARDINALRRAARRDDEAAAGLLAYYESLEPFALILMGGLAAVILGLFAYGMARGRKRLFDNLMDASDGLARVLSGVGIVAAVTLFSAMIFMIMYDVAQRQYMGLNPNWTNSQWYGWFSSTRVQEMEWHLHATLFLLCLGFAYVRDAHVRIELVRDTLRPRTRVWVELAGALLFMVPYCYVIMKFGIENALRSFHSGESSAAMTGLDHRFVIKSMLPLGFALIALAGLSAALKCLVYLFGPPDLRLAAGYYAYGHEGVATGSRDDLPDTAKRA